MEQSFPFALTIAGSDSSSGSGIQADLETFSAFKISGRSAITAITVQSESAVLAVYPLTTGQVRHQIEVMLQSSLLGGIKVGMLVGQEIAQVVVESLSGLDSTIVIDPVLKSSSGGELYSLAELDFFRASVLPLATVVTPNIPEAALLLGTTVEDVESVPEMTSRAIAELGNCSVLLKGGHASRDVCTDYLCHEGDMTQCSSPTLVSKSGGLVSARGTGCRHSSALLSSLLKGASIPEAARKAQNYVQDYLRLRNPILRST